MTEKIEYTLKFNLGYETSKPNPKSIKVEDGTPGKNKFPPNPERPAWDFLGWEDAEGNKYTRNTIITANAELTAKWNFTPGKENPLFQDAFTTDPAPYVHENPDGTTTLYLVTGNDDDIYGVNFYVMPRWFLYKSSDMKTFEYVRIINEATDFNFSATNDGAWAAQLAKLPDGKFYHYGTVRGKGGYSYYVVTVSVAEDVEGPYTPIQTPIVDGSWVNADLTAAGRQDALGENHNIDPTVFIDNDDVYADEYGAEYKGVPRAYLAWGKDTCRIAELDPRDYTKIVRPIRALTQPGWTTKDRYTEGPWLYKRNGKYYCFYASMRAGSTETISYTMADSLRGPWNNWEDESMIWTKGENITDPHGCYTIHPGVIDFKGMTYMFYHNSSQRLFLNGQWFDGKDFRRSVAVDYLYFDKDGKPEFMTNVKTSPGLSVPPRDL